MISVLFVILGITYYLGLWRVQHRPRWLWEDPGLFALVGDRRHPILLIPYPRGRGNRKDI